VDIEFFVWEGDCEDLNPKRRGRRLGAELGEKGNGQADDTVGIFWIFGKMGEGARIEKTNPRAREADILLDLCKGSPLDKRYLDLVLEL
jgi:hypothetical protein